jgi:hypothetical protein
LSGPCDRRPHARFFVEKKAEDKERKEKQRLSKSVDFGLARAHAMRVSGGPRVTADD